MISYRQALGIAAAAGTAALALFAFLSSSEPSAEDIENANILEAEITEHVAMLDEMNKATIKEKIESEWSNQASEVLEASRGALNTSDPGSALSRTDIGDLCGIFVDVLDSHEGLTRVFVVASHGGDIEFNRKHLGHTLLARYKMLQEHHPCYSPPPVLLFE